MSSRTTLVSSIDVKPAIPNIESPFSFPPGGHRSNVSVDGSASSPLSTPATKPSKVIIPRYKHAIAIHSRSTDSRLTPGTSNTPNFSGFKNLMVLVIVFSNLRLIVENFLKYGVLICIRCHDYRHQDVVLGSLLFFLVPFHLFIAYLIEAVAMREVKRVLGARKKSEVQSTNAPKPVSKPSFIRSSWFLIALAHSVNATLNLVIASHVVYYSVHHPGIGTLCELHAVIVWLKVCSYALTNRDLRDSTLSNDPVPLPELYKSCPYPQNITFGNLAYFWWAPTLVYQPVYPRTEKIRWTFVLARIGEVFALGIAVWIASAQYAVPLLQNSVPIISQLDFVSILERLLKLSSISLFCWLAGFFAIFQSALNCLAEVMRFGDREFYGEFWNSPNLRVYWSLWNKPVYQFMKRHIFLPLVGRGWPPLLASLLVFFFSAILHEMLVGIPTHNIIWVAFAGMMFQIPLIAFTELLMKFKGMGGKTIGNCIFWVSFVMVGQPLAVMLYFFAWQAKYGSGVRVPDFKLRWTK